MEILVLVVTFALCVGTWALLWLCNRLRGQP
jgi:hypothetical protein